MNCRAADRLYLRANGTVPCNCDIGENVTLFAPRIDEPESFDYVEDCYNGPPFLELRSSFRRGEPYLDCCRACFFFSTSEEPAHRNGTERLEEVAVVQVEPSFLCSIDCEACVPRAHRRDPARSPLGDGPYELSVELFDKLSQDLARAGVRVGEFSFCGRGEPLMHPSFGELLCIARRDHPGALLTACSNGNVRFSRGLLELDYLFLSIDGARQESYEEYRRGGDLATALRLIRDIVAARRPCDEACPHPELAEHLARKGRPLLRWKYILFEHNDSESELREVQRLARRLGVDQMMFTLSHTWNRSKKYTSAEQLDALPLFHVFDDDPVVFDNVNRESRILEHWKDKRRRREHDGP